MRSNALLSLRPVKNSGAALIIALLIVATVTGLAISFATDFQLSAARSENRWHGAQAREYLLAGEDFAIVALNEDEDKDIDILEDVWAQGLPRTPIEGGWIEGFIEDGQGRFNLNSLAGKATINKNQTVEDWQKYTAPQRRFIRLLQSFEDVPVDLGQAEEIIAAVIDWLDEDDEQSGFGGAESEYYLDQEIPYRCANQLMKSASELRLVKHMEPKLFRALSPFIIALPAKAAINVNTALPRVMRTINRQDDLEPLTELDGETMVDERGDEGFKDVAGFLASSIPEQVSQQAGDVPSKGLAVQSSLYILRANVEMGRQRRSTTTLLQRDDNDENKAKVLWRSDNEL